jgi:hypothetical protein
MHVAVKHQQKRANTWLQEYLLLQRKTWRCHSVKSEKNNAMEKEKSQKTNHLQNITHISKPWAKTNPTTMNVN